MIVLHTNQGAITIDLDATKAPKTVDNFLHYVRQGFFEKTLFHRVIDGFMIQGGGHDENFDQKPTEAPIENEAATGLKNKKGTIAMARTGNPHSATSQFFINLKDNAFLDFTAKTPEGYGYCAFGTVTQGMDVVEKIAKVATGRLHGHDDVPKAPVVIERVEIVEDVKA